MRVVLPFKLVGQTLVKGRDFPKSVADGSKDSIVIKVGGIPDGCIAKGYFKLSWESNTTYDLTFDGDELVVDEYIVTLPSHANNKYIDYKFSFSVAIWEGDVERLTTNPVEIVVEKSNYTDETTNTPDIPESQYDALANRVAEVADVAYGFDEDIAALYNDVDLLKESAVVVDDALSLTSENPVQNKVVTAECVKVRQELENEIDGANKKINDAQTAATNAGQLAEATSKRVDALEQNGTGGGITIDDVKPFRFTVTKDGNKYRSSATYEEIKEVIDAGNRIVICEFDDLELTFAGMLGAENFMFYTGASAYDIRITINPYGVNVQQEEIAPVTMINVLEYGAIGDGVTDDTEAIQDALYAAEESGLPLYFPTRTYLVSSTITTHTRDTDEDMQSNNLHIYGDGFGSVIKTTEDFDGDYVFYVDVKNAQPRSLWVHDFAIELYADVSGIYFHEIGMKSVVENLWITYLYDEKPSSVRAGIYCRMSTVTTFQRIKVFGINRTSKGHENIGIVCAASYSTKFVDCDVIFCKWAIYLSGGSNNCIERCRIDENEYGVYQNSSGGAYMDDTRAYPRDGKTFQGTFRNLTIRGNRFENNNKQAIFLSSYGDGTLGYLRNAQITIADNDFSGLGLGKAFRSTVRKVFRKAIHLRNCRGIVIANNAFSGMPYEDDIIDAFGRYVAEASDEVIADAKARKSTQNIEGSNVDDITLQGNVTVAKPATVKVAPGEYEHIKDENGNEIYFKTNSHLNTDILDATGFADNIEDDQSTRHNLGDVSIALDKIIAIQESLIGGDGE